MKLSLTQEQAFLDYQQGYQDVENELCDRNYMKNKAYQQVQKDWMNDHLIMGFGLMRNENPSNLPTHIV